MLSKKDFLRSLIGENIHVSTTKNNIGLQITIVPVGGIKVIDVSEDMMKCVATDTDSSRSPSLKGTYYYVTEKIVEIHDYR